MTEPSSSKIPITSDVPLGVQKEPNPERDDFLKRLKGTDAKIIEYDKNIKTVEQELGVIQWTYVNSITDDEPFKASELRDTILNRSEYNIVTDKNSEVIYLFTEKSGIYHKDGEKLLRTLIDHVLGNESSTHRINETITLLKYKTYATINPSKKIAVQNGLLDIETGNLEPFSKFDFVTNKLNVEYKEGAKSDTWIKFIEQVCPDDKLLLQEWSGYLLKKGYPYHAMMWLYGPLGRNGKGVWARTMQGILGEENYSAVAIDEFDGKHRFAVFNLHDSLFNICSEPRTDRVLTVEMIQALTGQDSVDAERKGVQERFKFLNPAKMTVMGNKFPNIDKPTDAFWDRLKLVKFPFRFVGDNQVPLLENTWLNDPEQRSGILNWMIEGVRRLIKNKGQFTATKTQQETIIQFKRASDSIGAFIAECIEFNFDSFVGKAEAQEYYKKYCSIIGVANESDKKLSEKLKNTPKIKDTSTRIEKQKVKIWKGIRLKPLPKEGEDDEIGTNGTSGTDPDPYTLEKYSESNDNSKNNQSKQVKNGSASSNSSIRHPKGEFEGQNIEGIKLDGTDETLIFHEKVHEEQGVPTEKSKIILVKRLAPNNIHLCEGDHSEAKIEAEFELEDPECRKNYYCRTHFDSTRKISLENGYSFEESKGENF